jgi:PBP1b-binding outer membrane lipoprotein LpoB
MKKIALVLLACTLVTSCATTKKDKYKSVDEKDVPTKFVQDFKKRRPEIEQTTWKMVDSTCYIAKFKASGNDVSMKFKNTSVETAWNVPLEYTPKIITDYIAQNYAGYKIESIDIVELRNKKSYIATIYKKSEEIKLQFDLQGYFTKVME